MRLSYVIVTRNRMDALLKTLQQIHDATPYDTNSWEVWIVDNASTDGTVDAIKQHFPETNILRLERNEGVGARSRAFSKVRGEYTILLDDDSYPTGSAVSDSIDFMELNPDVGAVVGRVILPNGSFEACALPTVLLSGAVCIRTSVIRTLGSFRREFFRKAGEYDFSFRIWQAGWRIERFEEIIYRHDKVTTGRSAALAHRMDLRNNLIIAERFLPASCRAMYREDWDLRYTAIARAAGHARAAKLARFEARLWRLREHFKGREVLQDDVFERIFEFETQERIIAEWAKSTGVREVIIADFSKNLYATYRACRNAGLHIRAISDNNIAYEQLKYRGIPIVTDKVAATLIADGFVLSNINPAYIDQRATQIEATTGQTPLRLWSPNVLKKPDQCNAKSSDHDSELLAIIGGESHESSE